jgi:hypothetical protein
LAASGPLYLASNARPSGPAVFRPAPNLPRPISSTHLDGRPLVVEQRTKTPSPAANPTTFFLFPTGLCGACVRRRRDAGLPPSATCTHSALRPHAARERTCRVVGLRRRDLWLAARMPLWANGGDATGERRQCALAGCALMSRRAREQGGSAKSGGSGDAVYRASEPLS